MTTPNKSLSDGHEIPAVGLGLWKITDEKQFNETFKAAVKVGYRHFDSAQAYGNEQYLGQAWRKSGLKREDLFITTKILVQNINLKKRQASLVESLAKLQTDYVDLLLIHFPGPSILRKGQWQQMEGFKLAGQAKSIGVSNYSIKQLKRLSSYAKEMPVVNQIEMHLYMQQKELNKYCQANKIAVEAYSPLAHGQFMNNDVINQIAKKHHKTNSQIMLRWCVDKGAIPLPKSVNPERLKDNFAIFDFSLDKEDLKKLTKLDEGRRTVWRSILSKG